MKKNIKFIAILGLFFGISLNASNIGTGEYEFYSVDYNAPYVANYSDHLHSNEGSIAAHFGDGKDVHDISNSKTVLYSSISDIHDVSNSKTVHY